MTKKIWIPYATTSLIIWKVPLDRNCGTCDWPKGTKSLSDYSRIENKTHILTEHKLVQINALAAVNYGTDDVLSEVLESCLCAVHNRITERHWGGGGDRT